MKNKGSEEYRNTWKEYLQIFKLSRCDASICNKALVFAISFPWRTQFYMAKLKIKSAKEM